MSASAARAKPGATLWGLCPDRGGCLGTNGVLRADGASGAGAASDDVPVVSEPLLVVSEPVLLSEPELAPDRTLLLTTATPCCVPVLAADDLSLALPGRSPTARDVGPEALCSWPACGDVAWSVVPSSVMPLLL